MMASSMISSSNHIEFDSVFGIDDAGMVQISVRDGMVVSTIKGKAVEIYEEVFATTFELPTEGLTDLSEVPKNLVFDARSLFSVSQEQAGSFDAVTRDRFLLMTAITFDVKVNVSRLLFDVLKDMVTPGSRQAKGVLNEKTVHRYVTINEKVGAEEVTDAPRVKKTPAKKAVSQKRPAVDAAVALVVKKKRNTKGKPVAMETVAKRKRRLVMETDDEINVEKQTAIENLDEQVGKPVDEPVVGKPEVVPVAEATTDDPDAIIEQVLDQLDSLATTDDGDQPAAIGAEERLWFDLPYEDLMARLDDERPVVTPSDTDEEMETGRTVGTDATGYFVEEPDKEMALVVEDLSADEAMSLEDILMTIPVGVPLPSAGVEFTKISLGKEIKIPGVTARTWLLASLPQIPVDNKGKEILVEKDPVKGNPVEEQIMLALADIECLVNLWNKVIDEVEQFFYSFSLKRLSNLKIDESYYAKEELVLTWAEAESTGVALQRKVYILMKYREMLLRKFLEARKMNFVPGVGDSAVDLKILDRLSDIHSFVLEELKKETQAHGLSWKKTCCSKIYEGLPQNEVPRQRSYDETLPPISTFFRVMRKQWADVCLEVCDFFVSGKLLPVGSINFCRSLPVAQPVYSFAPRQPTVFVASIASERTVLRSVRILYSTSVSPHIPSVSITDFVAQRIPLVLDQHSFSSSSSYASMHFNDHDTATTAFSRPVAATPDVTEALAQLQASIDQIRDRVGDAKLKDTLLMHLHGTEQRLTARLDDQDRVLEVLHKNSYSQKQLLSLDIQSSHKQLSTQVAAATMDTVDVRRVAKELEAKVTSLEDQVAATRHDLLEFSAQAQQTLNVVTDQLSELVAYINRGGNDKKGEVVSSSRPQPPPDDHNRDSGIAGGGGDTDRSIVERLLSADRQRQREKGRGHRSGSYKRRWY
ncbi:hypothetical protein F511_34080 [Dorcoceras hygrometricum]|uniref:Uncharacterized protein n=1 Tax=Dorcoceras hygrometricum TaxID=472368 RepID=A0A2Z7B8J2_9LAMI|nr:hypothetical protein F511_34080 [Dorcoceras hygrometricum]